MGASRRRSGEATPAERDMRAQEVYRANRELAAYFKGQRTEREARAALKIIKAFVKAREKGDAASRPPRPIRHGTRVAKSPPSKTDG